MTPASSNILTVRETVAIEMPESTAAAGRWSSSPSGWSVAASSTRAITRRWSVMRMPLATQASSRVWLMHSYTQAQGPFPRLAELHPHDKRGALPGVAQLIIALSLADHLESERAIEPCCRVVRLIDLKKA